MPFGLLQDCLLESPICYSKGIAFGVSYYTRIPLGVGYFVVAVVVVVVVVVVAVVVVVVVVVLGLGFRVIK